MKSIFRYLCDTIDDGLHYWRTSLCADLPDIPPPTLLHDNYNNISLNSEPTDLICYVDSDWTGDSSHCVRIPVVPAQGPRWIPKFLPKSITVKSLIVLIFT